MKNEIVRVGQIEVKFLLEAADTNGSMAMFEFTVPVGAKMPCHIRTSITRKPSTEWKA